VLPLELSLGAILIMIIAAVLIYAILLIKLKPLSETEQEPGFKKFIEDLEKPVTPAAEATNIAEEESALPVETQKPVETPRHVETQRPVETKRASEKPAPSISTRARVEAGENQKAKKEKEAKKSFILFGKRDFEGCPHKFGYLKNLPRNTPIPDECFGCPKVVECLAALMTQ